MKDENFYVVHGWMLNKLHLKGAELNVYAIIYGFTQDGETEFTGSRRYLSEFTGLTTKTIDNTLQALVEKGLITKKTDKINGVIFNSYRAVVNFEGVEKFSTGGVEKFSTNKIDYNNIEVKESKEKSAPTLEEVTEFARSKNRADLAQPFYEYFTTGNWHDSNGRKVRNWKQKFLTWTKFDKNTSTFSSAREYTKDEMNALFQNIDEIEI